jgi:alkanesulfonate monooxygenase SsuD/methylene tetrahydromethanopterin reductase-like flavin-dependent oxidoreductase (luciferase family)
MRISINVAQQARPEGPQNPAVSLERVIRTADEIGLDTVWVTDRPGRPDPAGSPDGTTLEAYTTLGFLASRSEHVRLGALAGPAACRTPELLVQAVSTLGTLSGGRAWLGVGAGYAEEEAAAPGRAASRTAGLPERFERMEDVLRLARQTWADEDRPRPPVLVAGGGEARMLPLVARYADACTLADLPHSGDTLRRKLDILAVHCRKAGRSLSGIDISVATRLRPEETSDDLLAHCRHFAALGIGHVVLVPAGPWTEQALHTLTQAAPAVHALGGEPARAARAAHFDAYRVPAVSIPV